MNGIKVFVNARLKKDIDNINKYKILYISAGTGYGKTTAVKTYCAEHEELTLIWFVINSEIDESYLFEHFYETVSEKIELKCERKNLKYEFHNIIEKEVNTKTVFIIDDWHNNKYDEFKKFILKIGAIDNQNIKVIIISQKLPEIFFTTDKDCFFINQESFEYSKYDIRKLFEYNNINISENDINNIMNYSEGWISAIYLSLINYIKTGKIDLYFEITEKIRGILYDTLVSDLKTAFLKLSLINEFTLEQAEFITGNREIFNIIEYMKYNNFFIYHNNQNNTYRFHNIITQFLSKEIEKNKINISEVFSENGKYFFEKGKYINSIENFYLAGNIKKIFEIMNYINPVDIFNIIPKVAEKIFLRMNEEDIVEYPVVYLAYIYSYIICVNVERGKSYLSDFKKLLDKHNIHKNNIDAEFMLIKAFLNYSSFSEFSKCIRNAYTLFNGSISKIIKEDTNFNFGVPCVLYLYHKNVGKMKDLCEEFKINMIMFSAVTNGCGMGSEYIINAEAELEIGNFEEAYALAQRACFKSRYNNAAKSVYVEARTLMARCNLINGSIDEAISIFDEIKDLRNEKYNPSLTSQIDMCSGYFWGILGNINKIPKWIVNYETENSKAVFQGKEACFIMFGQAMILKKDYERLLIHAEVMEEMYGKNFNIYRLIYSFVFSAIGNYKLNDIKAAESYMLKAVKYAEPDSIILPFIEMSIYSIEILKIAEISNNYIKSIFKKCKMYFDKITSYNNKTVNNNFNLSKREMEILKMLDNGLKQQEIADKLYISISTVKTHVKNIYGKLGVENKKSALKVFRSS